MNVAFIPVRGGSKSIALKNIKIICGKPLVYWSTKAACECEMIDKVFVATDSYKIVNAIKEYSDNNEIFEKMEIINRSPESATDTASTEFAMLEFANNHEFDNIVLIQATSPLLTSSDLTRGFLAFNELDTDSVLSVVKQKRFNWKEDEKGYAVPINYDIFNRPRRQDFEGYMVENGAFYITRREDLLKTKNRISGRIKAVEMSEDSFFEIDEPSDWVIVEALMKKNGMEEKKYVPEIKMFLTDCDGCLTDGGMYYSEDGDELKKFNTRDGMAFKMLRERGILTGIITSENVELNKRRAAKLKVDIFEPGCMDKFAYIENCCKTNNIELENVAYVGDDINDLEVIKNVGFGCCPADAIQEIKKYAKYVSKNNGGSGAIRDIAEKILV